MDTHRGQGDGIDRVNGDMNMVHSRDHVRREIRRSDVLHQPKHVDTAQSVSHRHAQQHSDSQSTGKRAGMPYRRAAQDSGVEEGLLGCITLLLAVSTLPFSCR